MKVYIIGKVTGLNYEAACSAFNERKALLEDKGHDVVSPVEIVPEDTRWTDAMRICIKSMLGCDAVSRLDNADFSRGATIESLIAEQLDMPIITV